MSSSETSEDDRGLLLVSVAAPVGDHEAGLDVGAGVGVKLAQTATTTSAWRRAFSLGREARTERILFQDLFSLLTEESFLAPVLCFLPRVESERM